jgi:hypothetical protein
MINILSIGGRHRFMIFSRPQEAVASRLGKAAVSAVSYIPLPFSTSSSGLRMRHRSLFALHNKR